MKKKYYRYFTSQTQRHEILGVCHEESPFIGGKLVTTTIGVVVSSLLKNLIDGAFHKQLMMSLFKK